MESSSKIDFHQEVLDFIKELHPSEKQTIAGVFSLLENDYWRDTNKIYFGIIGEDETWAVAEAGFTVAFVEEDDGTIFIVFLNKRSRFRPSWP